MIATSPYRDLELGTWRNLLVLAVTFHAVRARLRRLDDMGRETGPIKTVLNQLATAAQEASTYGADEKDEEAVTKAVNAWDANLDAALGLKTLEPDARKLLTEVRRLMSHFVVRDPFQALFIAIEEMARDVYGAAWPSAELSVAHTDSHPHLGARPETDPYTVTALTLWPPNARTTEVETTKVELVVYCKEFGPAAFAALPMLLTHECVCHVPARQDKAKNDSTFAEGFMDWAACRFLQQWAGALDKELASAARWHANRLTDVLTQPSYGDAAEMRRRGHEAAEVLFSWFEEECHLHPDEAGPRVARLAVELNQVDSSIHSKDHFVSLLEDPFPPTLDDLLRRWVAEEINTGQLFAGAMSSFPFLEKQS